MMHKPLTYLLLIFGLSMTAGAQTMDWLFHPGEYSQIAYLGHDLFKVCNPQGKWGIVRADGHTSIDVKYDSITSFVENKALLLDKAGRRILGIVNVAGEMVKDVSSLEYYVTRYPNFRENLLPFCNRAGMSGYLNERGDVAIEPAYYFAAPFQGGIAAVQYQTGDFGLINKGGKPAIISNSTYPFISSPVNGQVLAITGSRKGGNALHIFKIDGTRLKKVKTLEDGMNIWLSDDFASVECQKGNRYYIDNQWRVSGSNSGNLLPSIAEEAAPFHTETSTLLGKTDVEGGIKITYLGNPIVNNVFPDVDTVDDYAIVSSRDGRVGVLRLNKSAAIEIKTPSAPVVFYHNEPAEVLLDVDLKAVNPDKLHWYRNETGYLTHSALEFVDGKYQLRMPYFKACDVVDSISAEAVDIAFTYDGLDWMHHMVVLESLHKNGYDVSVSGGNVADANGRCTMFININCLNGDADGKVVIQGVKTERLVGDGIRIPITESVPDNASKTFTYTVRIIEQGCPPYSTQVSKTVQGRRPEKKYVKKQLE